MDCESNDFHSWCIIHIHVLLIRKSLLWKNFRLSPSMTKMKPTKIKPTKYLPKYLTSEKVPSYGTYQNQISDDSAWEAGHINPTPVCKIKGIECYDDSVWDIILFTHVQKWLPFKCALLKNWYSSTYLQNNSTLKAISLFLDKSACIPKC